VSEKKLQRKEEIVGTLASRGAAVADLSAGVGLVGVQIIHLRHIDELKLNAGDGETDVTDGSDIPGGLSGKGSRALSLTVTLENLIVSNKNRKAEK